MDAHTDTDTDTDQPGSARLGSVNMDFNVKKLACDAGVFFTRAVQVSPVTSEL